MDIRKKLRKKINKTIERNKRNCAKKYFLVDKRTGEKTPLIVWEPLPQEVFDFRDSLR
jgi:adenylate kinase